MLATAIRCFALSIACQLIAGCGYMAISAKDFDYSALGVGPNRGQLWSGASKDSPTCSTSFLIEKWGSPDEKFNFIDATETWTYHNGLKWVGALPMLIAPLPLFAPAGKEKIHFGVRSNDVVSIRHETTERSVVYLPFLNVSNIPGSVYQTSGNLGCQFRKISDLSNMDSATSYAE